MRPSHLSFLHYILPREVWGGGGEQCNEHSSAICTNTLHIFLSSANDSRPLPFLFQISIHTIFASQFWSSFSPSTTLFSMYGSYPVTDGHVPSNTVCCQPLSQMYHPNLCRVSSQVTLVRSVTRRANDRDRTAAVTPVSCPVTLATVRPVAS